MIDYIEQLTRMHHLQPPTEDQIRAAEWELGLRFADDYREYVRQYGAITFREGSFSGISPEDNEHDVVQMTKRVRESMAMPASFYVLEHTGLNSLVAAQDDTGCIYIISPGRQPYRVARSLKDYLDIITIDDGDWAQ